MEHSSNKKTDSFLESVPSKFAFWAGVVTATAVLSILALGVMMSVVFKGGFDGASNTNTKTTKTNTNTAAAAANTNTAAAAAPSGSIDLAGLRHERGEGEITIVEFSDTECPFCKNFHATMIDVMDKYDGKVKWAYEHFPLQSLHKKAHREAQATECAADQDKFWEYTDEVFARTGSNDTLPDSELFTIADDIGLDREKFDGCLENGDHKDTVDADAALAVSLGGTGTPFPLIVDAEGNVLETIRGAVPIETLSAVLDQYVN